MTADTPDAPTKRKWFQDFRNILIALLAVVALVQAGLLLSGPSEPEEAVEQESEPRSIVVEQEAPGTEAVSVVNVALDQEHRGFLLLAFDRPVGQDMVGATPDTAPATIDPGVEGTWSWISPFVLRFDAADVFPAGSTYYISVDPEAVLNEGQTMAGETSFNVSTRAFQVDNIYLDETPSQEGQGMVVLTGQIDFSYSVDPEDALRNLRVVDTVDGQEVEVEVYATTTYNSSWFEFRTKPVRKTEQARILKVIVSPGLTPYSSSITLAQEYVETYSLFLDPRLKIESLYGSAYGDTPGIEIRFSTPVEAVALERYLTVEPAVPYNITSEGTYTYVRGEFESGVEYRLTFEQGLPAADGAVLNQRYSEVVFMPDLEPSVSFDDQGMFLSLAGYHTLSATAVNMDRVDLFIDRVYPNNLFYLLSDYHYSLFSDYGYTDAIRYFLGDTIHSETYDTASGRNEPRTIHLDLDEYIPESEHGIYRVLVKDPDYWDGSQRWVMITDLGLVAKKGEDDIMVWVASLSSLAPEPGVKVTLLSVQNQVMAEGVTDEWGVFHATGLAEAFDEHYPFMILAEKGDDTSFILMDEFRIDMAGQDTGGVTIAHDGYTAYLYGERDIYRPGETVEGLAVVRDFNLDTPSPMPLLLRQKDPQGKELSTTRIESDAQGLATFALDIPDYALTGKYTLELLVADEVIGEYRYQVEDFMPDRIKVEIAPTDMVITPGESISFEVSSRYFFGPPASGLDVEATVSLQAAPFAPEGYEDFNFGDSEASFDSFVLMTTEGNLDEEGIIELGADVPEGLTPPAALQATITARVRERGGRGVAARETVTVHAYERYPGLKRMDGAVDPGSETTFEYVLVTPEGEPMSGPAMRADFYKDRWQTVLRKTPSGTYRYESIRDSWLVKSDTLAAEGTGSFTFIPPEYGSYRVVLTDLETGARTQASFYASGASYWNPWAIENPSKLEIVSDQPEYMPGDEARFEVRAPFSGQLLVTVESTSVLDTYVFPMDENTSEIAIPVKEEYSPNVYLTAVLVRSPADLEPGSAARASGSVPFFVNREANKPDITLTAPDEVRPETMLTVSIQTEPNTVVTLAAVDEGILQLISQETPDPFEHFYAKRALGVESYDLFTWLFPEIEPIHGISPVGGDQDADRLSQFVRTENIRRVKPVAYWSGPIQTDENGQAQYQIQLPDFQGSLRLMCVAVNGRAMGSTHGVTRVRGPLVLTPTLPRFLSLNESVQVPVTLRNDTPSDGTFTLTMNVEGPADIGQESLDLFVEKGREGLTYFTVNTGQNEGPAYFTVTASGNEEEVDTDVELPIRSALPAKSVIESGAMQLTTLEFPPPAAAEFRPDTVARTIRVGGLPLIRFSGSLRYLVGYPYGCVEQTTSRAFPLLYFNELAEELDPDLFVGMRPEYYVQEAIRRLMSMQVHDGGFSMWPGGKQAYTWGTIYATHFLVEAKRHGGYHVSDAALDRALEYIAERVKGRQTYSLHDLQIACYGLFVLARAGKADLGTMDYLRTTYRADLLKGPGVLLGGAYAVTGNTRAMDELIYGNWMQEVIARETGGNLNSTLRNLAMRMTVLMQAAPDDARIPDLLDRLLNLMEHTPYRSTQENSFCFLALGEFFARQNAMAPYEGTVYLGSEELAEFTSDKPLVLSGIPADKPLRVVMKNGYEPGSAFYSLETRGIPTDEAYRPVSEGIFVERRILDREGNPVDLDNVEQGALLVQEVSIRSTGDPVDNVVVSCLLPSGLEIENPRLDTTERLLWVDGELDKAEYQDMRDDRLLLFVDLPGGSGTGNKAPKTRIYYSLLRVVTPGEFVLPPVQAEAMYDPDKVGSGPIGSITVVPANQADVVVDSGDAADSDSMDVVLAE